MARNRSPEQRKDRIKRTIVALVFVSAVIFFGGMFIQIDSVSPGRLDLHAAQQIRNVCGANPTCTVRLAQLIPGDWDTFYEFSPSVPREAIDHIVQNSRIRTAPYQRVLILTKDGKVVRRQYAHTGQTQPLAGAVVFDTPSSGPQHGWVAYPPSVLLQVTRCTTREGGSAFGTHGGIYFLLTPASQASQTAPTCPTSGDRSA